MRCPNCDASMEIEERREETASVHACLAFGVDVPTAIGIIGILIQIIQWLCPNCGNRETEQEFGGFRYSGD